MGADGKPMLKQWNECIGMVLGTGNQYKDILLPAEACKRSDSSGG